MPNYSISISFDNILSVADTVESHVLEQIHIGVGKAAQALQSKWVDAVMQAPGIWLKERQAYVQSITWRHTTYTSAVVETTLPLADEIENGRPARDLKRMLGSSTKVRQGKNGRYLIIPFRHNTTGQTAHAPAMPQSVYKVARKLAPSTVTGMGTRLSGTGTMDIKTKKYLTVAQRQYNWGGSLPAGLVPKMQPHHATDRYAGMKKFDTSSGKSKSSAYLTFRVMSEHSSGWIVPAKPGLHLARAIAQGVPKALEEGLDSA